jgi:hypothetical protein
VIFGQGIGDLQVKIANGRKLYCLQRQFVVALHKVRSKTSSI